MAKISISDAAFAGLGLIGRKPLVVLVWGLAFLLLLALPMLGLFALMGQEFARSLPLLTPPEAGAMDQDAMQQVMRLQSSMMLFNVGSWLWGTLVQAVICAAIFRAVLKPAQPGLAYLRLGTAELLLALLFLVQNVLAYIVAVLVMIVIAILAFIVGLASGQGEAGVAAGVITAVVLGFVALGLMVWVALRLSMAAPMTVAEGRFRLFESWGLTRGRGWALLGVGVLTVLIVLVIELLFGGVALAAFFAAGGPPAWLSDTAAVQNFMARPPVEILTLLAPWLIAGGVIWMLLAGVISAVFCAPWAAVYRDLTRAA